MSAHTREQHYCPIHHRWFNACCWECEEGDMEDTPDEREQQRVETYNDATLDERIADRLV